MHETPPAGSGQTTVHVGRWPLVFTLGLVVVLLNFAALPLLDSVFVSLLVVLLPVLAVVQLRAFPELELQRKPAYLNSMLTIALLGGAAVGLGYRRFGWEGMGLAPIPWTDLALWSAGLVTLGSVVMFAFLRLRLALGWSETPFLDLMLPKTVEERQLFVGVSLTAGFGEELVYRGYLLPLSWQLLPGVWFPTLLGALLFGAVHAYQGWFGVVRTVILAMMLSLSMIFAGTLWPAIVAHTAIDLLGGLVFADALTAAPRTSRA